MTRRTTRAPPPRPIAVGMEGAPGHQAGGTAAPAGMGRARGIYDNNPGANSFAGYPLGGRLHGPADLAAGAARAAAEHSARTAGRAVLFPGSDVLTGTCTVARLSDAFAIDDVISLGTPGAAEPAQRVVTRDHVRPEWRAGRLVLTVMPAVSGTLVPFEVPDPTACCADHG